MALEVREESVTKANALDWIAMVLVIIGGVNWGLLGLFGFEIIGAIFGPFSALTRIIYIVVGVAALYMIVTATKVGALSRHEQEHRMAGQH